MAKDQVMQVDFPFFQRDVEDIFGEPTEDGFADQYLKSIDLSRFADSFPHVKDWDGNPWNHKIYGNVVMEGPLQKAFGLIVQRGLAHELHTYDGCFNIRRAKGGNIMSMHSWGLAIDLDANRNPFQPDGDLVTSWSDAFVRCFCDAGFEWGGSWDRPKDTMHFQLPWIRQRSGIYAQVPYVREAAGVM